jgi:hypothetical protein
MSVTFPVTLVEDEVPAGEFAHHLDERVNVDVSEIQGNVIVAGLDFLDIDLVGRSCRRDRGVLLGKRRLRVYKPYEKQQGR